MEWIFELLFEIFGEFILQFIFEALAQAGLHLFSKQASPTRSKSPFLRVVGYIILGAGSGAFSLLLLPHYMLHSHAARIAYLALAPAVLGLIITVIGSWRAKRGDPPVGIDRFMYGYLFAFAFALVRLHWATPPL